MKAIFQVEHIRRKRSHSGKSHYPEVRTDIVSANAKDVAEATEIEKRIAAHKDVDRVHFIGMFDNVLSVEDFSPKWQKNGNVI